MNIRRPLAAATIAVTLAVAGCSSEGGDASSTNPTNGQSGQLSASSNAGPDSDNGSASASPEDDSSDAKDPDDGDALPTPDLDGIPDPVAEVNGDKIDKDEFVSAYQAQFQQAAMSQMQTGQDVDQDALKKQVADMLVNNHLLTQAADNAGITPSKHDIDATLQDIADRNGLDSVDDMIAAFKEQGMSATELRDSATSQAQVETFIKQKGNISEPTDGELHDQYDELVDQMKANSDNGSDSDIPDFDDVRDQLAERALSQEENKAASDILDGLRDSATITVNL